MKNSNIVIDTNIWVSYFLSKKPIELYDLIVENHLTVYSNNILRKELEEVVNRKKFRRYFTEKDIQNIFLFFDNITTSVKVSLSFCGSPDPKDDFLFALAQQTKSKFIVTGDKKLQAFTTKGVTTISLTAFKNVAKKD